VRGIRFYHSCREKGEGGYFSVFVALVHSIIAFFLGDDFACVFNDDLIWLECSIGADAVATVDGLQDFDADIILAPFLASLF